MNDIKDCAEEFKTLLNKLSEALGYEFAVFNRTGELIAYTDTYIAKKGTTVHKPFVLDVLRHNEITVKRPGEMEACRGCRFKNNCPSSFEILCCINSLGCPVAVLSLASFNPEDRDRAIKNIDRHLALVKEISDVASAIIERRAHTDAHHKTPPDQDMDFFSQIMNLAFSVAEYKGHIASVDGEQKAYDSAAFDMVIGKSPEILAIINKLKKFVDGSASILITGETGTGKELFARCIHNASIRFHKPFVAVNCGSIPETLFESELFGYEEGAFTGAKKGGKLGKFQLAAGGTIFLDEIGELPLSMQPKLLRVLQDNYIDRVGGTKSIPVGVRVIAATNRSIEQLVNEKKFRLDLYYRLAVVPVEIPPLRDRRGDIPLLAGHYLKKYSRILKKQLNGFSPAALEVLHNHDWRGNVRELENAVEYASHMEQTHQIRVDSLPDAILNANPINFNKLKDEKENLELSAIKTALDQYGWSLKGKKAAARELGISLRTLYRKLGKTQPS